MPDQFNPFLELGRYIHKRSYKDFGEQTIELPGIKMDVMWKEKDITVVGEVKKSSKSMKGAKMQLLYYLYSLKELGFREVKGYILIPKEKKRVEVLLTQKEEEQIKQMIEEIKDIVKLPAPPPAEMTSKCKKCAYFELCFA